MVLLLLKVADSCYKLWNGTMEPIPEDDIPILKPHGKKVTVGSQWTVSSPQQQAIFGCASKTHKEVCPRSRHSGGQNK